MLENGHHHEQISDFIKKLMEIMQKHPQIMCFHENGKQLIIQNQSSFINNILPSYFRHKQWKSFIRQMNMYDFRKLNRGSKTVIFMNPYFQRDNQENYHLIKRKIPSVVSTKTKQLEAYQKKSQSILKAIHSQTSIPTFINKTVDSRDKWLVNQPQIRSGIYTIGKQKKNSEVKKKINQIKESIQLIAQASSKLTNFLVDYSAFNQMESYNLAYIGQEDHLNKVDNFAENRKPLNEKQEPIEKKQGLDNFSLKSFNSLVNFDAF